MKIENLKLKIRDILFFGITSGIILTLNLIPLITQTRHAPDGRTFALINNNTQDFYFYQALMNEGANGAWLTSDPYTSEPHQSSIIFSYFLWLGKLSKLLGLSYALTYHLVRIILSVLFLYTVYRILYTLNLPYPRLTYFFFLFAAPFMNGSVPYMNWWNGVDPIRRAAFLPHHMLGGFLFIISIILIFKFINKQRRKYLFWLIVISAIMAFVHTPSLLIMLLILPATILTHFLINTFILKPGDASGGPPIRATANTWSEHEVGVTRGRTRKLGLYWLIGAFFLAAMVSQTRNGFPWSQYIDWEKNLQFPLDRELIGALGILLPFLLIGIYNAIRSKKFENIFIVCWLIIPFLFIPIAPKLNLSNIRLIQGVPYLPLAILAVLGIKTMENFINTSILKTGDASGGPPIRAAANTWSEHEVGVTRGRTRKLILLAILIIFSIFTYPTLSWSLKDQIREYWPIYSNVYLDKRLFNAFAFINQNFPTKTIILSTFYTGNYLPVFTNTVSFIGHFGYTYNLDNKEEKVSKFLKNQMTEQEAKNFLMNNKITLIFQGPEEKPLYKDYLYPAVLKVVYDKEEVTLYKPNF